MSTNNRLVFQFIESNGLDAGYSGPSQEVIASARPGACVVQECVMHTMEQTLSGGNSILPPSIKEGYSHVNNSPLFNIG